MGLYHHGRMKPPAVLLLGAVLGIGSTVVASGNDKPVTRQEFARAFARIKPGGPGFRGGGTREAEVLDILGAPDDIRTREDPGGITSPRTREIWCYGTDGHLTFPTVGRVFIDVDGTAQIVVGGDGTPPDPGLLPEEQLRR